MKEGLWPTLEQAGISLRTGTGNKVKIAVLDSGVEASHPMLGGLRLADDLIFGAGSGQIVVKPGCGQDAFGHGTAIAGILRSLVPAAEIGSFRILGGELRSRSLIVRAAALKAIRLGYHVLNCSFGCGRLDHMMIYKDWLDEAYVQGRHVIAACNNEDFTRREWPGHFPAVIATRFIACDDPLTFFRQSGRMVEFGARGQDLEVAWLEGSRKKVTGSSFAVAHITGLLARLLSDFPDLTPAHAISLLQRLARPLPAQPNV